MSQPTLDINHNAARAALLDVFEWDSGSHEATLEALEELRYFLDDLIGQVEEKIADAEYDEDDEDEDEE